MKYRYFDPSNEEQDIATVNRLLAADLSEPYSRVVYHFFLKNWPSLTIFAQTDDGEAIGVIIGSLKTHQERRRRGYVAMLAVDEQFRGKGIAKELIHRQTVEFVALHADEITLETECSNTAAIRLYESQGFLRTRRMHRYYFSSSDAFRLVLPLTERSVKPLMFLPPLPVEQQVEPEKF